MQVDSRVYHKGVGANGIVTEIDNSKNRDTHKVQFLWGKYQTIAHGRWRGSRFEDRKWQWCDPGSLVETTIPDALNRVTLLGNRSLEALIRNVCELPKYRRGDGSDIAISYGKNRATDCFTINSYLTTNKYSQQQILGSDLGIPSSRHRSYINGDVIIKPLWSMGGHGIYDDDGNGIDQRQYYQKKFNKVREFRCHVFLWLDDPVPIIQEKEINDSSQLCWNKKQGGVFKYPYQPAIGRLSLSRNNPTLVNELRSKSIEACRLLSYDMGGVDIGVDVEGNARIFEVNSRMGLREQTLQSYKAAFYALRNLDINEYTRNRW